MIRYNARPGTVNLLTSLLAAFWLLSPPASASLADDRNNYLNALTFLKQNQNKEYFSLKARLTSYPLYPYLEQAELEKNISTISQHHIDLYHQQYSELPPAYLLQQRWLRHLAKEKRWKQYLIAFNKQPINSELFQCHFRNALLQTGDATAAIENIESVWNQGHSITDACNPVFDYWIKQGKGPDSDLAYQRFWKAVSKNNISLARYLQRFIKDSGQKETTERFFRIHTNPSILKQKNLLSGDNVASRESYLHGIDLLSRKSPETATEIWLDTADKLTFSPAQSLKLRQTLARRVAAKPSKKTTALLAELNPDFDVEIQTRRINIALADLNWKQVYKLIDQLPEEQQQDEQWTYWKTVAASQTRGLKPEYSDAFYKLSQERSYYGLLAAQLLQSGFRLNPQQDRIKQDQIDQLTKRDDVKRMYELYKTDQLYLARREWNQLTSEMTKEQIREASTMVHQWGWHSLAIRGAAKSGYWDDITIRFPMPYEDLFQQMAAKFRIDTNWARAIARQESAYQPYARSHVGARGLMQLMPRTAKSTARKNDISYRNPGDLFKPTTNINLGVAYLAEMQKRFNNNQIYATAAYNAGPHRVDRWLKERGQLPIDIWIETIPFKETRNYVKSVMAYHAVYSTLTGLPPHMVKSQTAFRVAMQGSTGFQQAEQLRQYIQLNSFTSQTQ